jgi:NDP-sugar pyrophosphorylase family protein
MGRTAIILAGGKGTRLKPFTNVIPKPLVPIGDMPILEVVLRQLRRHGFTRITLAVNHLARLIEAFFGDGHQLGLEIDYSLEARMMGTAGPLKLVHDVPDDFLVMNGDLLTTLDFADLFSFHLSRKSDITIATFQKNVKIDLGVLTTRGSRFLEYTEKPTYSFTVSTGIYVVKRKCLRLIPAGRKYDLPELVGATRDAGGKVTCYRGDFEWLDIGRPEDYERAVELFEKHRQTYVRR